MTERCKGCGAILQTTDKNALGYTPKEGAEYCQRCYRLSHYGDVTISMQQGIDASETLEKISRLDATVFWIVDLFNLEECLISRLNQKLPDKDIVLIATKRDLLPDTLTEGKIKEYLQQRLQQEGVHVREIVLSGHMEKNVRETEDSVEKVIDAIERNRNGKDIVFMGVANAGKSTLINQILGSRQLTTSRNPGTTLDLVEIDTPAFKVYDSPGIDNPHSVLSFLPVADLKEVVPAAKISPRIYQIHEDQSFAVGGLARLDVWCRGKATVAAYFSRMLDIHRGKLDNADSLWEKHYGELLKPVLGSREQMKTLSGPKLKKGEKLDVYIYGLGWFCLSGDITRISVQVPENIYVSFRKAMI